VNGRVLIKLWNHVGERLQAPAHEICSRMEFDLRKGKGAAPLLARGRRKLAKGDLPRLTGGEDFDSVVKTHVRK
jgi:hypothetical protein